MCQILFEEYLVLPEWLVSVRLLSAGALLTGLTLLQEKGRRKRKKFTPRDFVGLLLFSLIGMLGVQYTYFKAIQYSGAAIATILQFTGPIFIFLFLVANKEKRLNFFEFVLMAATFIGVFFIVMEGGTASLSLSTMGFFMGIASAVTLAFYTIQPRLLLIKYGEMRIAGLGMLIAGLAFQLIHPVWRPDFQMDCYSVGLVISIIIFGTALPFLFQLSSLRFIDASLASVLTVTEPILATILSVLLFNSQFAGMQVVGFGLVLFSVIFLTRLSDKNEQPKEERVD
jgi:drug/metabolite transporter (DMT)-like permease